LKLANRRDGHSLVREYFVVLERIERERAGESRKLHARKRFESRQQLIVEIEVPLSWPQVASAAQRGDSAFKAVTPVRVLLASKPES